MPDWPELRGAVEVVAPRLLGAVLRHGPVAVRITEVEAYAGSQDPGSHAFGGPTPRSAVMFGAPGRLYCYLSYGMHVCANVVTGEEGTASAVLLRAGEVVDGLEEARRRRPGVPERDLARGPGRLCRSLGIVLTHDGTDLASGPVTLEIARDAPTYVTGPRTGLRLAAERKWRFWFPGDRTVSPYRRHPKGAALAVESPDLATPPEVP